MSNELARRLGDAVSGTGRERVSRRTELAVREVAEGALVSEARVQGKAFVTHTALQLTASLTALEEQAIKAAPLGEPRYKVIVDAFAIGAANEITRWRS